MRWPGPSTSWSLPGLSACLSAALPAGRTARLLRRGVALACASGGLAVVVVGTPLTAPATAATTTVTATFTNSSWTVPAGITSVHVRAVGASGGSTFYDGTRGGSGAVVETDLAVSPGDVLTAHVGGAGAAGSYSSGGSGGSNGGAAAGSWTSGGGGGASDLRLDGDALADRVVVAAGGGGAAFYGSGSAAGGDAGAAGNVVGGCSGAIAAQPGTESAGGAGSYGTGDCSYWTAGGSGSFGAGGAGGFNSGSNTSGGGGGAGWYGGGGGGQYASGAGGSSHVDADLGSSTTVTTASYQATPTVVVTYALAAQDVTFGDDTPTETVAGTSTDLTVTGGGSGNDVVLSVGDGTSDAACTLTGSTVSFAHAGTCEIVATQAGDDVSYLDGTATATITVDPAPTTTDLDVEAGSLSATVGVDDPSTLLPEGEVTFSLGDEVVGTADLADGTATLDQDVPAGSAAQVTASFAGTADLEGSQDTATRAAQSVSFDDAPDEATVGTTADLSTTGGASSIGVTLAVGAGTTGTACTVAGSTVTFAHAGTCEVRADQAGDWRFLPAAATTTVTVAATSTTTAVAVGRAKVTATVSAAAPSTLVPTGTVEFLVDGESLGTAALADGTAVLSQAVPTGATRTVTARYLGSDDATSSQASVERRDPTISATVSSAHNPVHGWYRTPVTVSFTCQAQGSALVSCPSALVLTRNGRSVGTSGTVTAKDGGSATATVAGLHIDTVAPKVHVTGVRPGRTYRGVAPTPRCVARDGLSGSAGCDVTEKVVSLRGTRTVVRYTATGEDVAGNVRRVVGRYTLVPRG
ncbi:Ig-like domain-containing protein [Nocardioides sp. GY 10127]|uniref:Ig-like domain-containing protein n=1 Tax=Nocardioides sp. GY 10127 TaxID=2569762 RepID=UPI0010A83D49|nr:Ig-like domain-containing protein [Nocardioides sp. GY 10127]TIC86391.1 Ig-like domain repeat protein [Nocardioides sp. GY 10127]